MELMAVEHPKLNTDVFRTYLETFRTNRAQLDRHPRSNQSTSKHGFREMAEIYLRKKLCSFLPKHEPRLESIEIRLKSA